MIIDDNVTINSIPAKSTTIYKNIRYCGRLLKANYPRLSNGALTPFKGRAIFSLEILP